MQKSYIENHLVIEARIANLVNGRIFNNYQTNVFSFIELLPENKKTKENLKVIELVANKAVRPEHLYEVFGMPMPILPQYKTQWGLLPDANEQRKLNIKK
jgi:hypothetical protein